MDNEDDKPEVIKTTKWKKASKPKTFAIRPKYFEANRVFIKKLTEVVRVVEYQYETKQ
jgi:hypothetical protein